MIIVENYVFFWLDGRCRAIVQFIEVPDSDIQHVQNMLDRLQKAVFKMMNRIIRS
jgi:hypothetical protein